MSRSKRSFFNYLSTLGLTAITLLISIASTPLLLRWLGQERLGAYRASVDWSGYLGLLELGFGGALSPMFASAISRKQHLRTRQVMLTGLRVYRWVTLLTLLGGATFVWVLPRLVGVGPGLVGDLRLSAVAMCVGFIFIPFSPLRPFLEGGQRGYVVNAAILAQSLVIFALSLLLAWRGLGVTGQWLALVGGGVVYTSIIFYCTWRHLTDLPSLMLRMNHGTALPETLPAEGLTAADDAVAAVAQLPCVGCGYDLRTLDATENCPKCALPLADSLPPTELEPTAQMWKLNGPTLALNICGRVSYYTDNILIAGCLGPAAVVPFLLTQRLAQLIQAQLQSIGNATWAALAELHATGQHELFVRRTIQLTQLVFVLGLAGMLPYLAFNKSFIARWVGMGQYAGSPLMALAVANGLLLSLFSFWMWPFAATQQIRLIVGPTLAGGIVNLAGSIIGTKLFGRTGPLWGTLISFFTIHIWWVPRLLQKTFSVPPVQLFGCLLWPTVLGLAYGIPLIWLGQKYPPHSWFLIAIAMGLGGLGYLALAAVIVLDAEQRQTLSDRFIKRFVSRRGTGAS